MPRQTELTEAQARAILVWEINPLAAPDFVAKEIQTHERTVRRWLNQEPFRRALRQARQGHVDRALVALQSASIKAVRTLEAGLASENESARLRAADLILGHLTKLLETCEFAERLSAIEDRLGT